MSLQEIKERFVPRHEYFVCIDSDGCAFDTMEIKHKECFCPATIHRWGLQPISRYAREAWEYVNLYSKSRGCSRFHAIVKVMDLLESREAVKRRNFAMPETAALRRFVEQAPVLNNDAVEALAGDPVMKRTLEWSLDMNRRAAQMVYGIPPFPLVRESLEQLGTFADIAVVSATPREALEREWSEHGLDRYVAVIGAQEDGSKREMIGTMKESYRPERCLMIGDAPGDWAAAQANGILFYPIRPNDEESAWEEFYARVLDLFRRGEYAGDEMNRQLERFESTLPGTPPWEII